MVKTVLIKTMLEHDNIKKEIILEVLSTHKYLIPSQVNVATKHILKLKLNNIQLIRFAIHGYRYGWIGRNSDYFNNKLYKIINNRSYNCIPNMLKSIDSCWPEFKLNKHKLKQKNIDIISKYYEFLQDFIHTALDYYPKTWLGKVYERYIFRFDPMYDVEYNLNYKIAKTTKTFYDICLIIFEKDGGIVPKNKCKLK